VIYEISDANPAKIHLTVTPGFRRYIPPAMCCTKLSKLSPQEWEEREG
jgi:hypothetical protein